MFVNDSLMPRPKAIHSNHSVTLKVNSWIDNAIDQRVNVGVLILEQGMRSKEHEPMGWWNVVARWMVVTMPLALNFTNNAISGKSQISDTHIYY